MSKSDNHDVLLGDNWVAWLHLKDDLTREANEQVQQEAGI